MHQNLAVAGFGGRKAVLLHSTDLYLRNNPKESKGHPRTYNEESKEGLGGGAYTNCKVQLVLQKEAPEGGQLWLTLLICLPHLLDNRRHRTHASMLHLLCATALLQAENKTDPIFQLSKMICFGVGGLSRGHRYPEARVIGRFEQPDIGSAEVPCKSSKCSWSLSHLPSFFFFLFKVCPPWCFPFLFTTFQQFFFFFFSTIFFQRVIIYLFLLNTCF